MNVNDYSKEDLLKIIGLETDYEPSVYLINTKINDQIITIGVGDNQNDIEMLRHTDYACLVKNDNFDSSLINIENLIKSSEPSPQGWADVIKTAIQKIES